jgi:hypothetical protein
LAAVTDPSLVKAGRSFCHRFHRGAVADVFVAVDDDVALAALDRDGRDLVGELAGLLRGLGLVLAADGEFVLHVAGDLPLLGHVLGGLAHVVAVEGVPQTVADHRVDVFQVAHLLALPQRRGMGAHRHVFLPAGDDDVGVAQHDVLGAQRHGTKARAADLVDAPGRAFLRQACVDMRLTRRVLPCAAVSTWPRMVSETSDLSTPARSTTASMTMRPSSCAGVLAKEPRKLPTGVRAALAMTTLVMGSLSLVSHALVRSGMPCRAADAGPIREVAHKQGAKTRLTFRAII